MTTQTIRNGTSIEVVIPTGQTLKVVAVSGTYNASVVRGTGIGTTLSSLATGASYGPYAYDSVVRLISSGASEIDFDVAVTPVVASDTPVYASKDTTGAVSLVAGGKAALPRLARRRAMRIFDGRIAATHTIVHASGPGETFQATFELAAAPDAVWPILANGGGAAIVITGTKASVITSTADLNNSAGTWVTCNTGGTSGINPFAATPGAGRATWAATAGFAVLDNPTRSKIVSVRAFINTSVDIPLTCMGNGADGASDDFTNWASRAGHRVAFRSNVGDCITTPANFTSTTNKSYSPIIGVAYLSRGRVSTVMLVGDSTEQGRGTYLASGPAYEALRASGATGWEVANLSWAGTNGGASLLTLQDALGAGLVPDVLVRAIASPNDVSTAISDAQITNWRSFCNQAERTAQTNDVYLVHRAMQPANSSIDSPSGSENYGADDAKRVALNAEFAAAGGLYVDYSTPVSATSANANGQIPFAAGMTTDSIHQNDAGIAAQAAEITRTFPVIV